MVYDCFLFFNELDVLDIRLHELDKVVDKFVLVEATVTHTNKPKPLYYEENKERFKKFHKKIIHVVVKDSPDVSMTWVIERFQLSAVVRGLKNCKPNDTILYSCVDEVPSSEKIEEWKEKPGILKSFKQMKCFYFLNYVKQGENPEHHATKMFKYKYLKKFKDIYLTIFLKPDIEIENGGWHLSYMGGIKKIQQKLASFAHQELNNDVFNTPERITIAINRGEDPFGFGWKFKIIDLEKLPKYVQDNQKKFEKLLIAKEIKMTQFRENYLYAMDKVRVSLLRPLKKKLK